MCAVEITVKAVMIQMICHTIDRGESVLRMLKVLWFVVALAFTTNAMALSLNLRGAGDYSKNRQGLSLLIMQGDKVVFEEYNNDNRSGTRQKIYSGTKSFWAIAAMIAVEDDSYGWTNLFARRLRNGNTIRANNRSRCENC